MHMVNAMTSRGQPIVLCAPPVCDDDVRSSDGTTDGIGPCGRFPQSTHPPISEPIRVLAANIARTLRHHPESWCQKYLSRGAQACLIGQIQRNLPAVARAFAIENALELEREVRRAFCVAAGVRHRRTSIDLLGLWNDAPGRTVEDVIELCDRVASITASNVHDVCFLDEAPLLAANDPHMEALTTCALSAIDTFTSSTVRTIKFENPLKTLEGA